MFKSVSTSIPASTAPALCAAVGRSSPNAVTSHVARVISFLFPDASPPNSEAEVLQVFLTARRLTKSLNAACRQALEVDGSTDGSVGRPNPAQLALAFAACSYPQRAYHLKARPGELVERVSAFLSRWSVPAPEPFDRLAAGGQLAALGSPASSLPADITDGLGFGGPACRLAAPEAHERWNDGLLFLATLGESTLGSVLTNWREDASFVNYLRRCLNAPPATLTGEDRPTLARMADALPEESLEHHGRALELEQRTRAAARDHGCPHAAAQCAEDFWAHMHARLVSGFPFYSFQSRFSYWWVQSLLTFDWLLVRPPPLDDPAAEEEIEAREVEETEWLRETEAPTDPDSGAGVGAWPVPGDLGWLREGYRLIRTTFFRRGHPDDDVPPASGTPPPWIDPNPNRRIRAAVDALFYRRLMTRIDTPETTVALLKDVAEEFPDLGPAVIRNLSDRLPDRVWAYALARSTRLKTSLFRYPRKGIRRKVRADPPPPGVRKIAALSRSVPMPESMLWIFAAHTYISPRLEPNRPDPWTSRGFVAELWHWVNDPLFPGVSHPRSIAGLESPVAREILVDLARLPDEEALAAYLSEKSEEGLERSLAAIQAAVGTAAPDHPPFLPPSKGSIAAWRKVGVNHLVVSAWYLVRFEGLKAAEAIEAMNLEDEEVEQATALVGLMAGGAHESPDVGLGGQHGH